MNERPVLTEEPVRFPRTIDEDSFFYFPENEVFVRQQRGIADVPNPLLPNGQVKGQVKAIVLALFTIGVILAGIVSMATSNPLPLPIFMWGFFFGREKVIDYIGTRNAKTITQRFFHEGIILKGNLLTYAAASSSEQSERFLVEASYRYTNPEGILQIARVKTERPHFNGMQLPGVGTPVYVLYFSDNENYLL